MTERITQHELGISLETTETTRLSIVAERGCVRISFGYKDMWITWADARHLSEVLDAAYKEARSGCK